MILAAIALSWSCGSPSPSPARGVVLVVIDALRWDHVGAYGYDRNVTPNLDELARDSVVFDRAYTTAPWTMPSVASMLTGQFPSSHGAEVFFWKLDDDLVTLPMMLRRSGFRTAGVVSHRLLGERYGFQRGYDRYVEVETSGHQHVSTPAVTDTAVELLDELDAPGYWNSAAPFFLFVHYFDPHFDYVNHPGLDLAPESVGRLTGGEDILELRDMLDDLTEEEIGFLVDLYDEEIRFTDAGLGRLVDELRRRELYDEVLLIVTADHGEELVDRGWLGHTRTLYEELIHVPLMVKMPGQERAGERIEVPVSLAAITPTVLDFFRLDPTEQAVQASPLVPIIRGDSEGPEIVFSEVKFSQPDQPEKDANKEAVIVGSLKLIRDVRTRELELYDLESDPGELHDLSADRPELVRRLEAVLEEQAAAVRSGDRQGTELELSEEELERLRSLGYVR